MATAAAGGGSTAEAGLAINVNGESNGQHVDSATLAGMAATAAVTAAATILPLRATAVAMKTPAAGSAASLAAAPRQEARRQRIGGGGSSSLPAGQ